jgi:phosphoribosylglycinamide formyltransferase-1
VAVVVCNVAGARALERAEEAGVPAILLAHGQYPTRDAYDAELVSLLRKHGVQLVCLAGFMRLLTPVLLSAFQNNILNIHPSLLPAYPGLHAVKKALTAGARVSGCTVHIVDEGTDTGPIVIQAAVPVLEGDTEETLAARILMMEHRCYPRAISLWAQGRIQLSGRRVVVQAKSDPARSLSSPELTD